MSHSAMLRSKRSQYEVGIGYRTRVMALFGATNPSHYETQLAKLEAINRMPNGPEIVADLSLCAMPTPLWKRVVMDTDFVPATLPIYTARARGDYIDPQELLELSLEQMEGGCTLLTIHPTPTRAIVELAAQRMVPWTSRGGGMVIRDMMARHSAEANVYMQILPELIAAARKHGATLSLGASFRSANVFDSNDPAQQAELASQRSLAEMITAQGVGVVIESPGHARPQDIAAIGDQLRTFGFPVMPLGPIATDAAIGQDHIAACVGAVLLGMRGAAHVLAAVTREEHTGGIPNIQSTIEAIDAARVAAHIIDISLGIDVDSDLQIARSRQANQTCVAGKETRGCSRCSLACPLWA